MQNTDVITDFSRIKNVDRYRLSDLQEAIENVGEGITDLTEVDRCYRLAVLSLDGETTEYLHKESKDLTWIKSIELEVYCFLQGQKATIKELNNVELLTTLAIDNIINDELAVTGVPAEILTAAISLLIIVIVKIHISAWCTWFRENKIENDEKLRALYEEKMAK